MHLSKSKPTLLPIMDKGRLNNCIKNICLRKKNEALKIKYVISSIFTWNNVFNL